MYNYTNDPGDEQLDEYGGISASDTGEFDERNYPWIPALLWIKGRIGVC